MEKEFNIQKHNTYDKTFQIEGPGHLSLEVNYDDVDHKEVDLYAEKMVNILNDHWNDPKYSPHAEDLKILAFEKWLVNKFYEISEDVGNSESIEEVETIGKDPMIVTFTLDAGRAGFHKDNSIRISKSGKVIMQLAEVIEGGDIDGRFKRAIEEKIKEWKE